jgi:hypothetical protein
LQWSARFKNKGFYDEKEWRLVLQRQSSINSSELVQFREGRFGRTPYVAIPLGLKDSGSPLQKVVVGPSPNKEQPMARLKVDLEKIGIRDVEVVPSSIPYRNW